MDDYITTTNATSTNAISINWDASFNPEIINSVPIINPLQEKIEQYVEKIEKHVDQLEEDIDFFNNKRLEQNVNIEYLLQENAKKDKNIADLQIKIEILEKQVISLTHQITVMYSPTPK